MIRVDESALKAIWLDDPAAYVSYDDITVEAHGKTVSVSQMYEYLKMGPKQIMALSALFGTDKWDIDNWAEGGCETCDYGSKYEQTFTLPEKVELARQEAHDGA